MPLLRGYKLLQVHMAVIEISKFTETVMKKIHQIPKGKVATYKQIAALAGKPHGSRGVAWILHSCSTTYKLPWHRILNSQGRISFPLNSPNFRQQKKRLEAEGVVFTAGGQLSLAQFQWKKKPAPRKQQAGLPKMFGRSDRP